MKTRIAMNNALFGLGFSTLVFATSMPASAQVPVPDAQRASRATIYEAALANTSNPNLSQLVSLLSTAFGDDLEDIFDGEAKYTVFGPTNAAFGSLLASLTSAEQAALLDTQNGLLAKILLYHVAPGDWYRDSFPIGALPMANGDLASVYWNGEVVEIEGATIGKETVLKNGIFHAIDAVIVPPGFLDELQQAAGG